MKRILFVSPSPSKRGGHIVLTELMRNLPSYEYHVDILLLANSLSFSPENEYVWRDIKPIYVQASKNPDPETELVDFNNFMKQLASIDSNYDHVILDSWRTVHAAIRNGLVKNHYKQLVQSDPEFTPENPEVFWKAELMSILPRFPLQKIHVSKMLSDLFMKRYETNDPFINLGVRSAFFETRHTPTEKKRLKIISVSGDIRKPRKGKESLEKILQSLNPKHFELTLVTPTSVQLNSQISVNHVSVNTDYELARLLSCHDIFLTTSESETFGLAQAEGMAVGLPTVAFDAVGNRTYMNKKNSLVAKSPEEAVKQLHLLTDLEKRADLSKKAKKDMSPWTINNMVKSFEKVLDSTK